MKRIILTGAPGAGKTVLLRQFEIDGFPVVEEAATDVIALEQGRGVARPWETPDFIEKIARLQLLRQSAPAAGEIQFHDRSMICTHALAVHLGFPIPALLTDAILASRDLFEPRVFFVRLLGFITPTDARRISLEESQRFEAIHEASYRQFGFSLESIPAKTIDERIQMITAAL